MKEEKSEKRKRGRPRKVVAVVPEAIVPTPGKILDEVKPMEPTKRSWKDEIEEYQRKIDQLNHSCDWGGCLHSRELHYDDGECHALGCQCKKYLRV